MNRLEEVKKVIEENIDDAMSGIFDTRNFVGDIMDNLYYNSEIGVTVDICYGYSYFEVFGLSKEEFEELEKYYNQLVKKNKKLKMVLDNEEFANFLNDVNELATEKYGWNVDGYEFSSSEVLELLLSPAIGADAENRKF